MRGHGPAVQGSGPRALGDDLDGALVGAVATVFPGQEWGDRHFAPLGLTRDRYFNNGVMLMDLARMRDVDLSSSIRDFALEHRHLLPPPHLKKASAEVFVTYARDNPEKLLLPEQDATNAAVADRWNCLHPRLNCMLQVGHRPLSDEVFGSGAVDAALANPAVLHFEGSGRAKPWHPHTVSGPEAAGLYRTHRDRTPWATRAGVAD